MRRPALLALGALLAAVPARAATLRVETASVVFADASPGMPGRIQLTATFTGLTVDPRNQLRLSVGRNSRWVTLHPEPGNVLAARSGAGYTVAVDLPNRRLTATEVDVLAARENPVAIELRQASLVACTMIELSEAEEARWTFTAGRDRQFPCVLRDAPEIEPAVLTAGVETKVRFRVATGSSLRPDKGGLRLVRVGDPAPLCELRDRGRAEEGDTRAGDGVFACVAPLTAAAPGALRFRAEGAYGGARIASPSATLEVRAAE